MTFDLRTVAPSTAARLAALIQPDGRFLYAYDAANGGEIKEYNFLRHAACIWALNEAAQAQILPSRFDAARKEALSWLMRKHLVRSPQVGFCLVENGRIKLGGNALLILAILSFSEQVRFVPGSSGARFMPATAKHPDLVEKLCDHMLAQVKPDGDFHHVRSQSTSAVFPTRSDYYTGQALFALFKALKARSDLVKLGVAFDLLHGLAAVDYGIKVHAHWMMYAIEAAYELAPDAALLAYAGRLAEDILNKPQYRDRLRSTPIACRSEALLAYLRILRRHGATQEPQFARVKDAVFTNLSLQMKDYLPDGAFCEGEGRSMVRIDFLQHNLAAFFGYFQLES